MFARGQTGLLRVLLGVASAACPAFARAADQAGPKTAAVRADRYGDPLPPGAIARLGTLRLRHQGRITHMAFSPDGKILASTGQFGTLVRLWDRGTGKEIRAISGTPEDYEL